MKRKKSKYLYRKWLSLSLAVCMLSGGGAATVGSWVTEGIVANAAGVSIVESGKCGDNVNYTLDSEGTLTISGTGDMYNYSYSWSDNCSLFYKNENINKVIIKDGVTSIGDCTFEECTSLTSISIPNSVTSIGDCTFEECTSLTSISIPNSVTSIGESAFYNCTSLTSISIPDNITNIGDFTFYACYSLTSINIPNSVTSIGESAFGGCNNLISIEIPNSVTSIGKYTFSGCTSLKDVYYSGTKEEWNKININTNNNECLLNANIHYNSDNEEDYKEKYTQAHLDFLNRTIYTKITDDWVNYCVSSKITNFEAYQEIKDNYNKWRIATGDYFENPYDTVVGELIYSEESAKALKQITKINLAKEQRKIIKKLSEIIDFGGYDFDKEKFVNNLELYLEGKTADSAAVSILETILNENADGIKKELQAYDKLGKGIKYFEKGQGILKSVVNVINYNSAVNAYYNSDEQYKEFLKNLQKKALEKYKETKNIEYSLLALSLEEYVSIETEQDVVDRVVQEALKETISKLWDKTEDIIKQKVNKWLMRKIAAKAGEAAASKAGAFLMGAEIGKTFGIMFMDGLFDLSGAANEYIKAYYQAQMADLFKDVLKDSAKELKSKQTYESALKFHDAMQMYKGMETDVIDTLISWYDKSNGKKLEYKSNLYETDVKTKALIITQQGKALDMKTSLQLCKLNWNNVKCPVEYDYDKDEIVVTPIYYGLCPDS